MESEAPVAEPPAQSPAPTPVMDVRPPDISPDPLATPPPDSEPEPKPEPAQQDKPPEKPKPPKPASTKQSNPHVTIAIIATVIIVLGLAAIATYAFLKTR